MRPLFAAVRASLAVVVAAHAMGRAAVSGQEMTGSGVTIRLESAGVTGPYTAFVNDEAVSAPARLLDRLGDIVVRRGHEIPVTILVHDSVPLGRLREIMDMAGKAGFMHVRCYYFTSSKRYMTPISFGALVRYTTRPGP